MELAPICKETVVGTLDIIPRWDFGNAWYFCHFKNPTYVVFLSGIFTDFENCVVFGAHEIPRNWWDFYKIFEICGIFSRL